MKKFREFLKASVFLLSVFIIQGCVTVETDMKINKDFSGSTVSKLAIAKGLVKEEDLKIEISKLGIEKYTLKNEKSSDPDVERYVVEIDWKTEEDLRKILKFIGSGADNMQSVENASNNMPTNSSDTQKKEENSDTKIFKKEKNKITVDMGSSKIAKLNIKVDGEIISGENAAGTIGDNKKEITFYQGDRVNFKYKDKNELFGIILGVIGIIGAVLLIILGLTVLKKTKKSA